LYTHTGQERNLAKGCFYTWLGSQASQAYFVMVGKVFVRPRAHNNLTHHHMRAPQAQRKKSQSDLQEDLPISELACTSNTSPDTIKTH
jgi:hypothetical protein